MRGIEATDLEGGIRWAAAYSGWREVDGGRYPFKMALSFPDTELRAEIDFEEVELNPRLETGLFRPGAPGEQP